MESKHNIGYDSSLNVPKYYLISENSGKGCIPFCLSLMLVENLISPKFDGEMRFRLRATLFDNEARRFLSRTWIGPWFNFRPSKSNKPTISINYQQNTYILTTIQTKLSVVIEVAVDKSKKNSKPFSLGWALIQIPLSDNQKMETKHIENEEKRISLYQGTPRILLLYEGKEENLPPLLDSKLTYRIFPYPLLLKVADIFPKDCIFGECDDIPGLSKLKRSGRPWKPRLARTVNVGLNNIILQISSLKEFEKNLLLIVNKETTRDFKAMQRSASKVITERRMKVFVHNGWTTIQKPDVHHLTSNNGTFVRRKRSDKKHSSAEHSEDELIIQHHISLKGIPEDPRISLIFVVEYLVSWTICSKEAVVSSILKTYSTPVPLLSGVWHPFQSSASEDKVFTVYLKGGPGRTPDGQLLINHTKAYILSFLCDTREMSGRSTLPKTKQNHRLPVSDTADERNPEGKHLSEENKHTNHSSDLPPTILGQTQTIQENNTNGDPAPVVGHSDQLGDLYEELDLTPLTFGPYVPITPPASRHSFSDQPASRGSRTWLHSLGFAPIRDRHGQSPVTVDPLSMPDPDKTVEIQDVLQINCIILQFLGFSSYLSFKWDSFPKVIFITFQFYRFSPTRTERLILKHFSPGLLPSPEVVSYILYPLQNTVQSTSDLPGFTQKYTVDPAHLENGERESFLEYLLRHSLILDIFDGDSLLYLGSASFPLKYICRQGQEAVQTTLELDVVYDEYLEEYNSLNSKATIRGKLHVRMGNVGYPLPLSSIKLLQAKEDRELYRTASKQIKNEFPVIQKARPLVETAQELVSLLGSHLYNKQDLISEESTSLTEHQRRKLSRMLAVRKSLSTTDIPSDSLVEPPSHSETDRWNELKMIETFRKHHKHEKIVSVLEQAISQHKYLFPKLGAASFFEFEFQNVFPSEQKITIEINSSEVKIVTDSREWFSLREQQRLIGNPVEHMLVPCENADRPTWQILLQPKEKVMIPFKYQCWVIDSHQDVQQLESVSGHNFATEMLHKFPSLPHLHSKVVTVKFKTEVKKPLCVLHIHLQPLPPPLALTMHFMPPENDLFKKWIRIPQEVSAQLKDIQQLSVRCSDPSVICGIQRTQDQRDPVHAYLKVSCSGSGTSKTFLVFLYADHFQHVPIHIWSVMVTPQQRIDVVCVAGDKYYSSLVVRGSYTTRLVQLFSSNTKELRVDPDQPFILAAGSVQELAFEVLSLHPGKRHMHITLVDKDLHQLLNSWLVVVTCHTPAISKAFQVQTFLHNGVMKQISFTNPYQTRKVFIACSNRPDLLHLKDSHFALDPGAKHILGLFIHPQIHPSSAEVLVFIKNEENKNEETFALLIDSS